MNKLLTLMLFSAMSASALAAPTKPATVDYNKLIKTDQQCILSKTGVALTADIEARVPPAVKACMTDKSASMILMAQDMKKNKVKNTKDIKTVVIKAMENMTIRNIEYCAGMEKTTVDSCLTLVFTEAGEQRLP